MEEVKMTTTTKSKIYMVTLHLEKTDEAAVEVQAPDKETAKKLALELAYNDKVEWDDSGYYDSDVYDVEVYDVEEKVE